MAKKTTDQIVKENVMAIVEATGGLCWKQDQTEACVRRIVGDRLAAEEIAAIAVIANTSAIRQGLEKAGKIICKSKGMFAD